MKLRRHGTGEEVTEATRRLVQVLEVVSVSSPYPDRGARGLVRVDLEARLDPADPGWSAGTPPGHSQASRPADERQRPRRGGPVSSTGRSAEPAAPAGLRDAALGYASRGIPVLPLHYPLPHRPRPPAGPGGHPACRAGGRAARVGIRAAARPASIPSAPWSPTGSRRRPPTGPASWPGGPATPRPTSAWPPATASTSWTSTAPPAPHAIRSPGRRRHGLQSSGPLVRTGGGGWHYCEGEDARGCVLGLV